MIGLSKKVSTRVKKHITFTLNYGQLYKIGEKLIEEASAPSTPRLKRNEIFVKVRFIFNRLVVLPTFLSWKGN